MWLNFFFSFVFPPSAKSTSDFFLTLKGEYPTGHEVQAYIRAYAKHFDIYRHVCFECRLLMLRKKVTGNGIGW